MFEAILDAQIDDKGIEGLKEYSGTKYDLGFVDLCCSNAYFLPDQESCF